MHAKNILTIYSLPNFIFRCIFYKTFSAPFFNSSLKNLVLIFYTKIVKNCTVILCKNFPFFRIFFFYGSIQLSVHTTQPIAPKSVNTNVVFFLYHHSTPFFLDKNFMFLKSVLSISYNNIFMILTNQIFKKVLCKNAKKIKSKQTMYVELILVVKIYQSPPSKDETGFLYIDHYL